MIAVERNGSHALRRDRRRSLRDEPRQGIAKPNVKVAETRDEYDSAFRLIHDVYVEMGYMEPETCGLRVLPHHALPGTAVFLARDERQVLGTVSLILDGPYGLPMDDLYAGDLEPMRCAGRKLAEVSCLAVDPRFRWLLISDGVPRRGVFWLLHQALLFYARRLGIDHLCVTVNPRHVRFYRSLYLFERIGEVKSYDKVCGAPAVALHLDLNALPEKLKAAVEESDRMFDLATFFFRLEHGFFQRDPGPPRMPAEIARHFLVERTKLLHFLNADRADLLARMMGFADSDALLAPCTVSEVAPCSVSIEA